MHVVLTVLKLIAGGALAVLIALLPLPLAAVLVVGSVVLLLALINPLWALCAAVLAVPVQDLLLLPGGLSMVQAALLLALGTWTLQVLAYPEQRVIWGRIFPALVLLVWVLALASVFTPYSRIEALKETVRWAMVLLAYLLALNTVGRGAHPRLRAGALVACLLLAPTANALFGLGQSITGAGPESFAIVGDFVRAYGTIGQPNSFAGYMNMGWPLGVALAGAAAWQIFRRWSSHTLPEEQRRIWPLVLVGLAAGGAALVLLGALLASFSRGGWLGALGAGGGMLVALVVIKGSIIRRAAWQWAGAGVAAVLLLVVLAGAGVLPDSITQRVDSIARNLRLFDVRSVEVTGENFAVVERMAQIQAAWGMVSANPLTGVGPGNYTLAYEGRGAFGAAPYSLDPWYESRGHAHNYYLHITAESGIVGGIAYLLLLLALGFQVYVLLKQPHSWFWVGIIVGGCGIIIGVAVHNMFENLHVLNMGIQLGAIWGLLSAVEQRSTHE
jgi:O-antigen ligase